MKRMLATIINRFGGDRLEYSNANNVKSSLRVPFGGLASGSLVGWVRSGITSTFQSAPQVNMSPARWKPVGNGPFHLQDGFYEIRARVDTASLGGGASYSVFGETPAIGAFSSWKSFDGPTQYDIVLTIGTQNIDISIIGVAEIRYRDFPTIVMSRGFENYVLWF